jgi:hypothetical protein
MASRPVPVVVTVSDGEAAELLRSLLQEYVPMLEPNDGHSTVTIEPVDDTVRSVVIYRVIQASRTVAQRHPDADQFLITEDGSRRRLPPPAL